MDRVSRHDDCNFYSGTRSGTLSSIIYHKTIVGTALPSIVGELGGGESYSWVGAAYLISSTAFMPLHGRMRYNAFIAALMCSDLIGRKPILYSALIVFLAGSALCGSAQSKLSCGIDYSDELVNSCPNGTRPRGRINCRFGPHCVGRLDQSG
jgi:MFS family permease